ncbi:hypothetical protein [Solitalea canadensis]|uniref:EamA-like transporter family n=1 Tax=Solitalea canadensis (strain ATCC 29591 / DSM 3403 / JCM 21819 / LMG 8368 / NBRC 15130 / NCIMB 12057 / USAM 9D) TaxID=929556 RepID=H8KW14_SOLCM|nr:hypothetical protein [Solitalea canadensis]AFD06917.1 hypothetical protein Solca_1856 [Solitalea canadensis DSM 3403]
MFYIFLSILCSVAVAVLLKLFNRYSIDSLQAIIINYPTALILSYLFFKPDLQIVGQHSNLLPEYTILALLLLSLFYFISRSITYSGMVITAVAQRLSLLIPVLAAFILFGEQLNPIKIAGLLTGFLAIILSLPYTKNEDGNKKASVFFPLIVFSGTGVIDVLFNRLAQNKEVPFTTALSTVFGIAMFLGFIVLAYLFTTGKSKFSLKTAIGGLLLGSFNFFSIIFYLKALHLESTKPSVIFSALDVGVITLGSIVGFFIFSEKLSLRNKLGILVAIISIIIFSFA